ncbi:MAG TPA: L-lactate permease [Candidatus Acidoferrales bacterium]|nr:L-lactate permease [Candidatus Acidoferrales bacterium]
MKTGFDILFTLLPFAVLFVAFLIFKLSAFKASLCAWLLELVLALSYYHMSLLKSIEASLWGNLTMWAAFLVLYTGQIFGQSYRNTGLLQILLESIQSILPSWDQEGQAVALVTIVGGFIGAFNGFATYPVTIPGLVDLGFEGISAVTSYLVYFSWTLPFNSLFIAPSISNAASHVPVIDIVRVSGLLSIPLVFLSLLGFLKLLGFRFFEWKTQILFWSMSLGNVIAIVLFTQIWPEYYIVMLFAGATIALGGLYLYGYIAKRQPVPSMVGAARQVSVKPSQSRFKAFAPLILGAVFVVLTRVPGIAKVLERLRFGMALWGYSGIRINIVTSAGFFIFVTALVCYLFRVKDANPAKDLVTATRRSRAPLSTLVVGSATVYLMVDTGQIALLGRVLSGAGKFVYTSLYPSVAFLGGMAFGQGLPADFLFSRMQLGIAPTLGIPLMVLVGIVTVITMGPNNALKPTQIAYTASLANVKGRDGEIFRTCLPWQILQLVVTAILAVILVFVWK